MPGLTSSYSVLTYFLYAFSRIELNPHSETMGVWMIFAFSILYMSFGIYHFIRGFRTDKEERFQKKREEKLEDLDKAIEHYRVLVKNSSEIIYKTDLKGTLTYVNPAATRLLKYSEEELLGKTYLELIRPDCREATELFYRKQLRSETETTYLEFPAVTKSGEEIWLAQHVQLLNEGKEYALSGLQATARDITARRETEEKLNSNEELFHQFIRHTPAAVAMFDREMCYMAASDRWLQDFRIGDERVLGRSYYDLFPGMPEEWREIHQSCLTGVSYKCEEEPFPRKDGTVEWLQWEAHPWYEVPGKVGGLIMFKELVTGRKKTEKTLLKAKEMAEETSRMKAHFIEKMSHELRTPLTSILGYAQTLKIESGLTEGQYDQVDRIKAGGEYLLEIINDLLELSDFETGKIEFEGKKLDLSGLIHEIVARQAEKYVEHGNRHRIDIDRQAKAGIYTDIQKVKTIAANLINNAFKFTEDGEISVACEITAVEGSGADRLLIIRVTDTGPGIPEEKIDTVFQPFTQVTERYNQGTGLGLALAYRFCRFLGGSIEARSEVGKGSSFTVKIPVQKQDPGKYGLEEGSAGNVVHGSAHDNGDLTAIEIVEFINSLDSESGKVIREALEIQDLETISEIDNRLDLPVEKKNGALEKLKSSARNYDYLFITKVSRELQ